MPSANATTTTAAFNFIVDDPKYKTKKPYVKIFPQGTVLPPDYTNVVYERRDGAPVEDIRGQESKFKIDEFGFELFKGETQMNYEDFADDSIIRTKYYQEVENLVKEKLGASRIHIFDHTLRHHVGEVGKGGGPKNREPSPVAHIDQTPESAKARILRTLPDESAELLGKKYQIINVWRPLFGPCYDWPLAFLDYRTLDLSTDVVATDFIHPTYQGESYNIRYNISHKWYFVSGQEINEVWMFKSAEDGFPDSQGGKMTGHASFDYSGAPPDARPRESIEVRVFAFYD